MWILYIYTRRTFGRGIKTTSAFLYVSALAVRMQTCWLHGPHFEGTLLIAGKKTCCINALRQFIKIAQIDCLNLCLACIHKNLQIARTRTISWLARISIVCMNVCAYCFLKSHTSLGPAHNCCAHAFTIVACMHAHAPAWPHALLLLACMRTCCLHECTTFACTQASLLLARTMTACMQTCCLPACTSCYLPANTSLSYIQAHMLLAFAHISLQGNVRISLFFCMHVCRPDACMYAHLSHTYMHTSCLLMHQI